MEFYFWFASIPLTVLKIYLKQGTTGKAPNFESKNEYQILSWTKSLSLASYILQQKCNLWYALWLLCMWNIMWYIDI